MEARDFKGRKTTLVTDFIQVNAHAQNLQVNYSSTSNTLRCIPLGLKF